MKVSVSFSGMVVAMSCFIASKLRCNRASSTEMYVSGPNRSHSSETRRAAIRQAATMALRSLRFQSFIRTWLRMRFSISAFSSPER